MAPAALATDRRKALSGESGWAGLVKNRRVFAIAVFASLGGLYGVFSGVLPMTSFVNRMGDDAVDSGKKGWLVAILELGAWFGVLVTGYLADRFSRKYTIFMAVVVFCVGVIVQTTAKAADSIYGGRFVTGMGVGSLSMCVPLYNAELAPPEVRGSLVALQQLAITFGIMVSFWIDYGTNFIGGTGPTQHEAAWRIPLALQLVPAVILGVGILFMPFSPRWLVNQGREDEALAVLARARQLPPDNELVQIEFLEIKAQHLFEKETSEARFPQYQNGTFASNFKLGFHEYLSLITNKGLFWRIAVGSLTMFFQQWTGVNAILYYAPSIFKNLGLTGNTTSLLATGVVGVAMFLATIPAVIWVDQLGRKPVLVSGAFMMAACHFIVAALSGSFGNDWPKYAAPFFYLVRIIEELITTSVVTLVSLPPVVLDLIVLIVILAAGWAACAFVWIFAIGFGYSWGPCAWIIVAEIYPLSVRGKGLSIAASSNWMNNFIVGQVTPSMIQNITFGTFIFFGVPETKGVTLEEMEEVFSGSTGLAHEDQQRLDAINVRLGLVQGSDKGSFEKA
ncbi:sugar transporter [Marasmius fiardii PR-910]|nr:sugar transporter [Marasmius fiardii PR-910]